MSQALARLTIAVEEFGAWVQLPKLPKESPLIPKIMFEFSSESVWTDSYLGDPTLPGCYIFEDEAENITYVGSVSASRDLGRRLADYLCKDPANPGKIKKLGNAESCRRIYVISVPKHYAFIAPALEQFLISYLTPLYRLHNAKDIVDALIQQLRNEGKYAVVGE